MHEHKSTYRYLLLAASLTSIGWWSFVAGEVCAQPAVETAQGNSSPNRIVVEAGDLQMVLEKTQQGLDIGVPAAEKSRVVLDGLSDRYPGKRVEPLRENADAEDDFVLLFCDIHIEKAHLSRRWRADCLDYLNGSGLAGAVWTQESEHFAFPDGERYVVDCQ